MEAFGGDARTDHEFGRRVQRQIASQRDGGVKGMARKVAAIPLKRRGDPADIIGPAVFLASDDAKYVTGDIMVIDGGMTAGIE